MTYCLAIKVAEGIVGLADGRITSGTQLSVAHKLTQHGPPDARFFIMTSGLRSLRDKTVAYLERNRAESATGYATMLDAVSAYTRCLRQVTEEDKLSLVNSHLAFDLHTLIGGQLPGDREPTMYLVYPEGNWIEVDRRTPYLAIGITTYGKPILDRALRYETDLRTAMKLAYLSFDSTRLSSSDVGFPIDVISYNSGDRQWRERQFDYDDLREQSRWWNEHLTELATEMPDGSWVDSLLPPKA